MRLVGVRGALCVLPVVSFVGYLAVALFPALRVVEMTKVAENSVDYSIQNTARQALFLVTDRAGKYIGKTVIDTFVMRLGDVFAALTVALGRWLAFDTRAFARVNLGLVVLWGGTLFFLGREHQKRSAEADAHGRATEAP
jgi:AAA family ATP:ADP antiporter